MTRFQVRMVTSNRPLPAMTIILPPPQCAALLAETWSFRGALQLLDQNGSSIVSSKEHEVDVILSFYKLYIASKHAFALASYIFTFVSSCKIKVQTWKKIITMASNLQTA